MNNDPLPSADSLPVQPETWKYSAFISYRQQGEDRRRAQWLHNKLETFRTPRELRRAGFPSRLGKIFKDVDELAAVADLPPKIESVLTESRYLIVVCSPRSRESKWVGLEIDTFRALGRDDKILSFLIEGEPAETFHPRLLVMPGRAESVAASPNNQDERQLDPLAADVRRSLAVRNAGNPHPYSYREIRRWAVLRICATLLGCDFDDLRRRDNERRVREARLWVTASCVVLAVITSLAIYAFYLAKRNANLVVQEKAAKEEMQTTSSNSDFQSAWLLRDKGQNRQALAFLARSLRTNPANASSALLANTILLRDWSSIVPEAIFPHATASAFSPDERCVAVIRGKEVTVLDLVSKKRRTLPPAGMENLDKIAWLADGANLALIAGGQLQVVNAENGTELYRRTCGRQIAFVETQIVGGFLLLGADQTVLLVKEATGETISSVKLPAEIKAIASSGDKRTIVITTKSATHLFEVADGQICSERSIPFAYDTATLSYDGTKLCVTDSTDAWLIDAVDTATLTPEPLRHDWLIQGAAFAFSGIRLMTAGGDGALRQWDTDSFEQVKEEDAPGKVVTIWPTPDQLRFAVAIRSGMTTYGDESSISIFDGMDMRTLGSSIEMPGKVQHVSFSESGGLLAATTDGERTEAIWIWRLPCTTDEYVQLQPTEWPKIHSGEYEELKGARGVVEASNGKRKVTVTENIAVLSSPTESISRLFHRDFLSHAFFTADDTVLVTGASSPTSGTENAIRLWDAGTGKSLDGPITFNTGDDSGKNVFRNIRSVHRATDARIAVATLFDETYNAFAVPTVDRNIPDWVPGWLEAVSGSHVISAGNVNSLEVAARTSLSTMEPVGDGSRADLFLRWLGTPFPEKTALPGLGNLRRDAVTAYVIRELHHYNPGESTHALLERAPVHPLATLAVLRMMGMKAIPGEFVARLWERLKDLQNWDAYFCSSSLFGALSRPDYAQRAFEVAAQDPNCDKKVFVEWAAADLLEGHSDSAGEICLRGLQRFPKSRELRRFCGSSACLNGKSDWEHYFKDVLQTLKPTTDENLEETGDTIYMWAEAALWRGKIATCGKLLNQAEEIKLTNEKFQTLRAMYCWKKGDKEAALKLVGGLAEEDMQYAEWKNLHGLPSFEKLSGLLEEVWLAWITHAIALNSIDGTKAPTTHTIQVQSNLYAYLADYYSGKREWSKSIQARNKQIAWFNLAPERVAITGDRSVQSVFAANYRELALAQLAAGQCAEARKTAAAGLRYKSEDELRYLNGLASLSAGGTKADVIRWFTPDLATMVRENTPADLKRWRTDLGEQLGKADPHIKFKEFDECIEQLAQTRLQAIKDGWTKTSKNSDKKQEEEAPAPSGRRQVLVIAIVRQSQAELLGLQAGDIILRYNGKEIEDSQQLVRMTVETNPEQTISLEVQRGESNFRFDVRGGMLGAALKDRESPQGPNHE